MKPVLHPGYSIVTHQPSARRIAPVKCQDTVFDECYSRVVYGKQILDILLQRIERQNTFRYGHRSVPLQLQLLGSIAVYHNSACAAATSSP